MIAGQIPNHHTIDSNLSPSTPCTIVLVGGEGVKFFLFLYCPLSVIHIN